MDNHIDDTRATAHNHRVTGRAFDTRLGQRVREMRIETGRTQEQLGDACGVSYQQIQKYEAGENRIAAETLIRIARYLKKPPGEFFIGLCSDTEMQPSDPRERIDRARLLQAWNRLRTRPNNRRLLLQFAELLIGREDGEADDEASPANSNAPETVFP